MKNKIEHTTIRENKLFCLNCGGEHALVLPIGIKEMVKKVDAFNELHGKCEKTWVQPIAPQDKSVIEKAMFWNDHGERGLSSKTMWNCLMGNKDFNIAHPHNSSRIIYFLL